MDDYKRLLDGIRHCATDAGCTGCPYEDPRDPLCECANNVSKKAAEAIESLQNELKAYKETGLEPDEIADAVTAAKLMARSKIVSCFGVDADHIRELVHAEQDGRLVVLPCKVVCGTTIWWADSNIHTNPVKCEVSSFGIYTGPDGELQLWMNCYVYGPTPMSRSFRMSSIGKTVFLTREEAEAALAGKGISE